MHGPENGKAFPNHHPTDSGMVSFDSSDQSVIRVPDESS